MAQMLHFEVCRNKTHLFLSAYENETIGNLKQHVEGILKVPVPNQTLIKIDENGLQTVLAPDTTTLFSAGYNVNNAKAQAPAVVGLIIAGDERLFIENLSIPPPIPDSMRGESRD